MAMPSDNSFVPDDENSERAPNVDSYRITCIDFIKDISGLSCLGGSLQVARGRG